MITERLKNLLKEVTSGLGLAYPDGMSVEEPPGDFPADLSTNIALQLAKQSKGNPRELAAQISEKLQQNPGIEKVEIAGPGFLNISLKDTWFADVLAAKTDIKTSEPQKINVEFVSANPTGPLHIGNARGGPIGEAVARVLAAQGHKVSREFYVNDIGGQAGHFAGSVLHYYLKECGIDYPFPEKGYPAPYVQELAKEIAKQDGGRIAKIPENERLEAMRQEAIGRIVEQIKATCQKMGISFDRWYWQSSLVDSGKSRQALAVLAGSGATIEKDGAIWLKSGLAADDRETVLVKSDGTTTYFLDDIAYHRDKLLERGFDIAVGLLGANHSGHPPRMRAGLQGLGIDPRRYQAVLYQYVQLKEDGETKRMAKREGTFVTAEEVLAQVPRDVFTYFMLSKANETHMDFDLKLAKDTSEKNPVYYVQYAHARIHSLMKQAVEKGIKPGAAKAHAFTRAQRRLIYWLDTYAATVAEVGQTYRTHLLPAFAHELATRFHSFYNDERILTDDKEKSAQLLLTAQKVAGALRDTLDLMGIEALEKM